MADLKTKTVDYDILSADTVRQMHQKFMAGIEAKARAALPADVEDPEPLVDSLMKLLIASARKGIDIKADKLKKIVARDRSGVETIEKCIADVALKVHVKSVEAHKYSCPRLTDEQEEELIRAAAKRKDDPSVRDIFGDEDRIYLRLKGDVEAPVSDTRIKVAHFLNKLGYTITDYNKGHATNAAGSQQFRIGRILKDIADKISPDRFDYHLELAKSLLQKFMDDSTRTTDSVLVVISRNPADIASMSAGRAWSSCMGDLGFWRSSVPGEIEKGSLVAYLVSEKDPAIVSPLARILIKPYRETGALSSIAGKAFRRKDTRQIFIPDRIYGLHNDTFAAIVEKFVEENLNAGKNGNFRLMEGLYRDTKDLTIPLVQTRKHGKVIRAVM